MAHEQNLLKASAQRISSMLIENQSSIKHGNCIQNSQESSIFLVGKLEGITVGPRIQSVRNARLNRNAGKSGFRIEFHYN